MDNIVSIVLRMLGGVNETARLLRIDKAWVSRWQGNGRIPERHWGKIVELNKGITFEQLHHGHK